MSLQKLKGCLYTCVLVTVSYVTFQKLSIGNMHGSFLSSFMPIHKFNALKVKQMKLR